MIRTLAVSLLLAVPCRAEDAVSFKKALKGHAEALSGEMLKMMSPDLSKPVSELKTLRDSADFKLCMTPPAGTEQAARDAACKNVVTEFRRIGGNPDETARSLYEKEKAFDAFVEAQADAKRKDAATSVKNTLADAFNEAALQLEREMVGLARATQKACIGRPDPARLGCVIEQTLAMLEGPVPQIHARAKDKLLPAAARAKAEAEAFKP